MHIPGLKTLRQYARWAGSRLKTGALILGYHRIADESTDSFGICVQPRHFAEQLDVLRQHSQPVSLGDLVDGIKTGDFPHRAVAITFDDGYADTLSVAKPILDKFSAPATVFIATGFLGRSFWWDELAEVIRSMSIPSQGICLPVDGRTFEWKPVRISSYTTEKDAIKDREDLLRSLYELMLNLPAGARQRVFSQLTVIEQKRMEGPSHSPRALTSDEIIQLAQDGPFEIGSHSVNHLLLANMPEEEQRSEIQQSKSYLEELLGKPVAGFSYPNGSSGERTRALVSEAGYRFACTSRTSVVHPGSDSYQLPRFWIPDWDGDTFAGWLRNWLPLKWR